MDDEKCKPQREDCEKLNNWLKSLKTNYKCPADKDKYEEKTEPRKKEIKSTCPPGPYRDPPPPRICKKVCECIVNDNDLPWRGNPKDICFQYKNRYRLLRNPRKNKRCIALAKRQAALLEAQRKAAQAACEAAKKAAAAAAAASAAGDKMDCSVLPKYPRYEFTECQCEACKEKRRLANRGSMECKSTKPKEPRERIPGCGPQTEFPCNTFYNPRRRNKCICTCECAIRNKLV